MLPDLALILFVFAGLATPGPNVIMLLSSGVRFGFIRSLPHIFGVALGVGVIAGFAGFGVAALLLGIPALALILKIMAATWILYLAYRLLRSANAPKDESGAKPFTLVQAVLFQWVNPKVWAVALAAAAGFGGNGSLQIESFQLALAFTSINLFVCLFYTATGTWLRPLLASPKIWRRFLMVMAGLMALSALLVFL